MGLFNRNPSHAKRIPDPTEARADFASHDDDTPLLFRPDDVLTVRPEVSKGTRDFDTSARTETSNFIVPAQ